jgi:hypothetical protein
LFADAAKARIFSRVVPVGGLALHDTARAEVRAEGGIARVVKILRFFLGVEVVEITEEFVEAVHGGQKFVAVAQMVLAELAGGVALLLQQFRDGRVSRLQPNLDTGNSDLGKAGAERRLAGDEARPAGRAACSA